MAKEPSLAFSVLVACASAVHVGILTWRAYHKKKYDLWPVVLSCILFFINLLLVVFSILRTDIALEILLSLASGILILYQSAAAWKFVGDAKPRLLKYLKYLVLGQTILVLTTSILCTVLPYVLENGHKPFYTVLLLFFATWYVLLLVFYRRAFRKWKAEQPEQKHPERKNQKDGRIIIHDLLQSNIIFCSIALLGIIPSFLLYLFGGNFEHSLWTKYMTADVWFLRWIVRQFTRKSLRFWRWQRKTTNADTKPPIFATDGPPATNTDSNNKAPRMGSEVALLSPVHLKDPSNPNLDNTQRNSGQEAGYMHGPYDSWQTLAARSLNCADGGIGSVAALQLEIRCQNSHCTDNCTGCDGRNYPCIASDLV